MSKEKKFNDYKNFIVVDGESKMPMSFDGEQFCYCNDDSWQDIVWPIKIYSLKRARHLIKKHLEYRKENKLSTDTFNIIPVHIKQTK